jgi:hypothetical protein
MISCPHANATCPGHPLQRLAYERMVFCVHHEHLQTLLYLVVQGLGALMKSVRRGALGRGLGESRPPICRAGIVVHFSKTTPVISL